MQADDALTYFEKALEYDFEENFPTETAKLYDYMAAALQQLDCHIEAIIKFDKSIYLDSTDCNKYFSRSVSKSAILDFAGQIADLEKAIQISKLDNSINREYNNAARNRGYKNGVEEMYLISLLHARIRFDRNLDNNNRLNNTSKEIDNDL